MFKKLSVMKKLFVMFVISLAVLSVFTIITLNSKTEAVVPDKEQNEAVNPAQQTNAVIVKVQNYVSPEGKKCYQYTVENNADRPIVGVKIGKEESSDQNELLTLPMWWREGSSDTTNLVEASDSLSMVEVIGTEDQNNLYVSTKVFRANQGETRGFHVCMQSDLDSTYQTAHWVAYMMDGSTRVGQLINLGAL